MGTIDMPRTIVPLVMTRVALVLSLTHSGSTLLDLVLGGNSRCVGLGEVHNVLRTPPAQLAEKFGESCTCGEIADSCPFWGPFRRWLAANSDVLPEAKYDALLRHFQDVFGPDMIMVDSSKKIRAARVYHDMQNVELLAIHLLKDVRAYTVSQIDKAPADVHSSLFAVTTFRRWHQKNERIQRALREVGIPHVKLSYEELCHDPEATVLRLCSALGIDPEPEMTSLRSRNSHLIAGNRIRHDPEKRAEIVYDDRWLRRRDWKLAAFLHPGIMRYNAREVHGSGA